MVSAGCLSAGSAGQYTRSRLRKPNLMRTDCDREGCLSCSPAAARRHRSRCWRAGPSSPCGAWLRFDAPHLALHRRRRAGAERWVRAANRPRSSLWKFTSATSLGSTQVVGLCSSGFLANGHLSVRSASNRAFTCARLSPSKPDPDVRGIDAACRVPNNRPAARRAADASPSPWYSRRPRNRRCCVGLIFSQEGERRPGRYLLSLRLPMTPSKPLASAAAFKATPSSVCVHELDERRWQQALRQISPPIPIGGVAQIHAGEMQYDRSSRTPRVSSDRPPRSPAPSSTESDSAAR